MQRDRFRSTDIIAIPERHSYSDEFRIHVVYWNEDTPFHTIIVIVAHRSITERT